MVEYIFHIGMGKTGTSSIQKSLGANSQLLLDEKIFYAGMLFGQIHEDYNTVIGTRFFLTREPQENYGDHAKLFFEKTQEAAKAHGATKIIISNETIIGSIDHSFTFFEELSKLAPTRFIAYIRNPYEWLPSAYAQWGLRHKVNKGPTRPFGELAASLVHQYNPILTWAKKFPKNLDVRNFNKNVVNDFYKGLSLDVDVEETRALQRPGRSELYLRALYNNRFDEEVLPVKFQRELTFNRADDIAKLDDSYEEFFSLKDNHRIVDSNMEVFKELKTRFGLDMTKPTEKTHPSSKIKSEMRDDLLDMVVDISISQSIFLHRMSKKVDRLEQELREKNSDSEE